MEFPWERSMVSQGIKTALCGFPIKPTDVLPVMMVIILQGTRMIQKIPTHWVALTQNVFLQTHQALSGSAFMEWGLTDLIPKPTTLRITDISKMIRVV